MECWRASSRYSLRVKADRAQSESSAKYLASHTNLSVNMRYSKVCQIRHTECASQSEDGCRFAEYLLPQGADRASAHIRRLAQKRGACRSAHLRAPAKRPLRARRLACSRAYFSSVVSAHACSSRNAASKASGTAGACTHHRHQHRF
jgi:hypothetical protein